MAAKRSIALLALMALVFSLLAGCGSPKDGSETTEGTPAATTQPTEVVTTPPETEAPTEPPKKEYSSVELAEYVGERTVTVNTDSGVGSGFFIDSHGTLVTNYHVIEGAKQISVDVRGGSYDVSAIVDFSKVYDLAILKIDLEDTPYLEQCREAKTGEAVYAVGSSLGVLDGSFTSGTVSSIKRMHGKIECIQMDASIASGNSGGPLVNVYGEVVGVNAFSYTAGQNANLAIKIAMLDHLDQERNLSLSAYREWYNKETSRSYSPFDSDLNYYYSTVNTYTTITGQSCLYSMTEEYAQEPGYVDMCLWYGYHYSASELDAYTDYLNSIGFEYDLSLSEENQYFYYSEIDEVYIYCEVLTQDEVVEVMPMTPDALASLMS